MIIIGERINTSRKPIDEAVSKRDAAFIQNEAKKQVDAGADYIDVNAGSRVGTEMDDLLWLVDVVQDAVDVPLAIDSPDPRVMEKAIARAKKTPSLNSVSLESTRFEPMAKIAAESGCDVVALCMSDAGMPSDENDVLANAQKLVERLSAFGIGPERIYLDPLIQPVATDHRKGIMAIRSIMKIKKKVPKAKTVCGLSNISFGLPKRSVINRYFLICVMVAGIDAVIIDPLDQKVMSALAVTDLLLGRDEYCMNYLNLVRGGKIVE